MSFGKAAKPPRVPRVRTKSQGIFFNGSRGTLRTRNRKFGTISSFTDDLFEGELDPIANEKVSYLVYYMYYSTENTTLKAAAETDILGLSEQYGRVLKASQDVTFPWATAFPILVLSLALKQKLRGELQGYKNREDTLIRKVKVLRERLDDLSGKSARVNKECDKLRAKYKVLLSR